MTLNILALLHDGRAFFIGPTIIRYLCAELLIQRIMGINSLKKLTYFAALLLSCVAFSSQTTIPEKATVAVAEIEWLTWDEAITRMATEPKKIFVDVYTDWCGWCKRMDATTFSDKEIATYSRMQQWWQIRHWRC